MKLCLIAPTPPPYGGVANWEKIVEEEIRKHSDIELKLIDIAANKRSLDGRNIFDRFFYSGYVMLKGYFLLHQEVKKNRPDMVHMTTSGGFGFYRDLFYLHFLRKKAIPVVYHIHFGRTVKYKEENKKEWKLIKKAVSIATATIVLDSQSLNLLKPYSKSIFKINNPIDTSKYIKYVENTEKNKVVYMGWIIKTKGIEELLEAFNSFNELHKNQYNLELIGPGKSDYVKYLTSKYGTPNVTFTGEIDHNKAMERLSMAEIFILPSYTEGSPNVILEAMVLRKCIIATNVGGIPEMLENNCGLLIEPNSIKAISNALLFLSMHSQKRKLYGNNAYKKVISKYDIGFIFLKYKEVWEKAIEINME